MLMSSYLFMTEISLQGACFGTSVPQSMGMPKPSDVIEYSLKIEVLPRRET